MGKKDGASRIQEIVDETRESFDLGDFVRGRSVRTKTIRVFTDEVTAERRGGFERGEQTLPNGAVMPTLRSWGLVKELAEAQTAYEEISPKTTKEAKAAKAKVERLTEEIKELTATLVETSLEIELRAVPKVIKKGAYRAARQALGINGKLREEQASDFFDEHSAQTLTRTVVSITRHSDGARNEGISIDSARDLVNNLPDSEWAKVDEAINELLFEKVISDQVAADADF